MDSRYLQSFVYVIELGSIAEAARRLDLTPAAVAQRVKMLEDELGAKLVRRNGRTVGMTEAGERILDRARSVLHGIRDLRSDLVDASMLAGQLRLGEHVQVGAQPADRLDHLGRRRDGKQRGAAVRDPDAVQRLGALHVAGQRDAGVADRGANGGRGGRWRRLLDTRTRPAAGRDRAFQLASAFQQHRVLIGRPQ